MPGIPADALRGYGSFGGMAAMPQDVDTTGKTAGYAALAPEDTGQW